MAILVQCPNPACKASCSVAETAGDRPVRCPKCGKPFVVKPTVDAQKGDTKRHPPASNADPFPVLPAEFGRYRVLNLLGRGGMGAVYLAQDSQLGRQVALKAPFFDASESPQQAERFVREARSAAILQHPNICTVFDAGQIDGRPFITMAYIAGKPLEDEIDPDATMPQSRAAEIARKIALALEHAHRAGIVHRDLKPANVMLAAGVEPVVMDFGLAKRVVDVDPNEAKLTRDGGLLGTPSYMAPEQCKGDVAAIGPATDVYALGVILFEMLTGRTPYTGAMSVVIGRILTAPVPPVQEFRPEVHSRLDAICRKAMAKEPADRFASMAEFADALGKYLKAPSASPPPLPAPPVAAVVQAPAPMVGRSPFDDLDGAAPSTPALKKAKWGRVVGGTTKPAAVPRRRRVSVLILCVAGLLGLGLAAVAGMIVVKVRTPDGKETEVTAPTGSKMTVDPKGNVTVALPGDAPAATPAEITNGIGMKLKLIKPGAFTMGSPKKEEGRNDNEGQHEVEITRAFYMGAYPVTVGQFAAFVKDDGYQTDAEKDGKGGVGFNATTTAWEQKAEYTWRHPGFSQGDDHPVVDVSWNDATAFCAWLSQKEAKLYELPTEAEWEYACRAGTTTRYWCGDPDASLKGNANIADASLKEKSPGSTQAVAWNDGYAFTSPVGTFKPNPWGLYDMGGNVDQWCADGFGPYRAGHIKDPNGIDGANNRTLRGGSWLDVPSLCRSAGRYDGDPAHCHDHLGFRVVLRVSARTP